LTDKLIETRDGDDSVALTIDIEAVAGAGRYAHRPVKGAGHNLPQEAPQAFVDAVVEVAGY
jgi:pimeloyl-ACP methyl ester carboxylesterase